MRNCLILLLKIALLKTAFAQSPDWGHQKTLDSLLKKHDPGAGNPGFAVCIVENGQIVFERQFGLARLESRKSIGPETMFNIGSITKQFTAACILLLEEQGKLRRSDPVQKHIPELPDFGQTITLDHLMSHSSGIYDHIETLLLQGKFKNRHFNEDKVFAFFQKSPALSYAPGEQFVYSNSAYMLLNIVVERVSGMKTADFMQKNIFQPLGMTTANFKLDETEGLTDGTTSYEFRGGKRPFKKTKADHNALGATGIHCSLRDLARWQINFEKSKIGGPDFIKNMVASLRFHDGTPLYYGAGLMLKNYRGLPVVEHGGGWNSFLIQCRRFPEQGIHVLVASNNDHSNPFPLADKICDKILDFNKLPPFCLLANTDFPMPTQGLEGIYLSFGNRIRKVEFSDGHWQIAAPGTSPEKKFPLIFDWKKSNDTLLTFFEDAPGGYEVQFLKSRNGQVRGFFWAGGDYFHGRRFYEKLDETPAPSKKWVGKYRSDAFKQKLRVKQKRKSGTLKLKPRFFLGYTLEPISPSVFRVRGEDIVVRFSENGLVLGHYYLSNLRFSRP